MAKTSLNVAGRRIGFQPRRFPLCLSKRVGLRTFPHVVGVAECPTPGVEQFANDHFQTGNFTGWTLGLPGDFVIDDGTCLNIISYTNILPFVGSYDASEGNDGGSIENDLVTPVPVACIKDTSTFNITTADLNGICGPQVPQTARILYTDGMHTDIGITQNLSNDYVTVDLKPYLTSGKVIKGIMLILGQIYSSPPLCCVHLGQVSLKV
jgi:hypothetical protein